MAFICVIMYLIVIYIRPAEWVPIFHGWQMIDVITILTAIFVTTTAVFSKRGFVKIPHNRMMIGFLAAIVCSHLAHTYLWGAWDSFVMFGKIFIMYFLIVNSVTSSAKFKGFIWCLVFLTALLVVQGIQQHQTGMGWAGQPLPWHGRITWISIFDDPNDLAMAFVITVPILLGMVFRRAFIGMTLLGCCLLALMLYGIFLTNSRGAVVAVMAAVAFFFVKRARWAVVGGAVGGVLALLIFLFGPSRLGIFSAMEESAYNRLEAWHYGFQLFKANPLFGVGHGLFMDDFPLTAHNSFVLAFSELGFVGLFFWIGVLYTCYKGLSLVQKHCGRLRSYAYGLQASLVGFMVAAMFLSRTYNILPYLVAALSASLFNVARQETDGLEFRWTKVDTRNVGLLCIGMIVLINVALRTWL